MTKCTTKGDLPEDQTQSSQEKWPYLVELAVTCGAGVLPNPCNGDILVTFTPYELKTFAEKVLSSQAEQIRKLEAQRNGAMEQYLEDRRISRKQLAQANEAISALQARIEEVDRQEAVLFMFTVDGRYYTAKSEKHAASMLNHPDTHLYPDKPEDFPLTPLFTRPPITSQRELELLEVIEQMRSSVERRSLVQEAAPWNERRKQGNLANQPAALSRSY